MSLEQKFAEKKLQLMFELIKEFEPIIRKMAEAEKPDSRWDIESIEYDHTGACITYGRFVCGDHDTEYKTIMIDEIINYMEIQNDVSA